VALSALVGMFFAPGAGATSTTPRQSVAGSPQAAPVGTPSARVSGRDGRETVGRRAGSTATAAHAPRHGDHHQSVPLAGPLPAVAVLALAGWMAALAVGRVEPRPVRLSGSTPRGSRGRAPPAYATA
jgi:hypothetical protein